MASKTFALSGPAHDAAFWAALRLKTFTYESLSAEHGITLDRASSYVRGWVGRGWVEALGKGDGRHLRFRVTPAGRAAFEMQDSPPDVALGSPHGNLWRTMRRMKSFAPTDLAAHSSTDRVPVSVGDARAYCRALLAGDYLKVERTARPGHHEAIYRLIRDTGPRPPRERRVLGLYDENLGYFVHIHDPRREAAE